MKIPFTNLEVLRVGDRMAIVNKKSAAKRIWRTQLYRSTQSLTNVKNAVSAAESEYSPDRTLLAEVYQSVIDDLHLWSVMQTITLRVLASGFYVEGPGGAVDDKLTDALRSKWFRDILKWGIEAKFHGFSVVQVGGVSGNKLIDNELIPRQYVVPECRAIKLSSSSRVQKGVALHEKTAISFDDPVYSRFLIPLGDPMDLGLLRKCAPYVVLKKGQISAWAEFSELFGQPVRIMYMDVDDPGERAKAESMLENMGRSAWGLFGTADKMEFLETNRTDAFKVYDAFIERVNSELSKAIVGQTMTSDDGSSLSQASVHADLLDEIVSAYLKDLADSVNDIVFPKLWALGVLPMGTRFVWDTEKQLPLLDLVTIIRELSKLGDIDIAWIEDTFGIPIVEKAAPDPAMLPGVPGAGENDPETGEDKTLARIRALYARATAKQAHQC